MFVAAAGSGGSGGSGVSTAGGADVAEVADFGSLYLIFDLVDRFGLAAAAGGSVMVGMIHKLWQVILDHRSIDRSTRRCIDASMCRCIDILPNFSCRTLFLIDRWTERCHCSAYVGINSVGFGNLITRLLVDR